MAKKLTVEVDADVSRAKRKVQQDLGGTVEATGSSPVPAAARRTADALDGAARASKGLDEAARQGSSNLRAMTKAFGGMALGMATRYAAKGMQEGSAEQTAVSAVGGAASGAMMGSAFGPLGALAGGLMGLASALLDAKQAEDMRTEAIKSTARANREQLEDLWKAEDRTAAFKQQLKELGNISGDSSSKIERITAALAAKKSELSANDAQLHETSSETVASKDRNETFGKLMRERSTIKGEISQLEALLEAASRKTGGATPRESMSALDSLARIGGGNSGGDFAREQLSVQREMAGTLKSIDQKTKQNGGSTWQ